MHIVEKSQINELFELRHSVNGNFDNFKSHKDGYYSKTMSVRYPWIADMTEEQFTSLADTICSREGDATHSFCRVRGETTTLCKSCSEGYYFDDFDDGKIRIIYDDEVRCPSCWLRKKLSEIDWDSLLPASHSHHRTHNLKSWDRSPIANNEQEKIIKKLLECTVSPRGWIMAGPPGTSKTTLAAAGVIDIITQRLAEIVADNEKSDTDTWLRWLNYHRIKAPSWLSQMEQWEFRDFDNPHIQPPKITPDNICNDGRPILWIEELDKFKPTENRLRNLYCLIDAVYEEQGTIISTTNMTLTELKKHVGEPIYRRLTGEYDDPKDFIVWDFHSIAKRGNSPINTKRPRPLET